MATLKNIISNISAKLNIKPKGYFNPETRINHIQISADAEKVLCQPHILYIGLKENHYTACEGCCIICFGKGKKTVENCLFLPEDTDILTVYHAAEKEILRDIAFNKKKEELFSALKGNTGLQGIINIAVTYLNNPVVVVDTSLSILCSSKNHSNAFDFIIQNGKQYMKPQSVKTMHQENLIERIKNASAPFITYRENTKIKMMYCRIRIRKSMVGYLCVLAQERPFSEYDFDFVASLSDIISIEMQKDNFFSEKCGLKYEYFLTDLIEGHFENADFIHERLVQFGYAEGKYYQIMTAEFENRSRAHLNQQYLIEQLVTILPDTIAFFYQGNVVLLKSFKGDPWFDEGLLLKLTDFLKLNQMKLSVSYQFSNLLNAPQYYHQTISLLDLVSGGNYGKIYYFEDYCVQTLIAEKFVYSDIESFIHPDIKFLLNYDYQTGSEYYHTLCAYLKAGRSATQAAQALHIHKTTFFYRLQKMQELLKKDLKDSNLLFDYEFSVRCCHISKQKNSTHYKSRSQILHKDS